MESCSQRKSEATIRTSYSPEPARWTLIRVHNAQLEQTALRSCSGCRTSIQWQSAGSLGEGLPMLGHLVSAPFTLLERRLLRTSDAVVATSIDFLPLLRRWHVPRERTTVVENWAPLDEVQPLPRKNAWAIRHGLVDKPVFLYAGTLGRKHDPTLLVALADAMPNAQVVVVSDGVGTDLLGRMKKDRLNLLLLPLQPAADLPEVLASADVLVALLEHEAHAFSVPSKVLTYLAAGRPILGAIPEANLAARTIRAAGAGAVVDPLDRDGFVAAARGLLADPQSRAGAGRAARAYAEQNFDIEAITDRFESIFEAARTQSPLTGCIRIGYCGRIIRYTARGRTLKKALITGITGQDGSYLAELLLEKGYEVHGLIRRSSQFNTQRIDHLFVDPHEADARLFLHYADLTDSSSLIGHLHRIEPAEVYNLGAQSHVKVSFEMPEFTAETVGMGTLRLLEAIRTADWPLRYYQAGSSEMYGRVSESPQSERTQFNPRSPYAVAKLFAHFMTVDYREAYELHASNGILFNHESPRRGGTFVTRKVTQGIASILSGRSQHIYLGNLDAKRDWGYAKEYVEAMWLMLQQPEPDDYVIATGETHSVRELCEVAFGLAGLDWERYVRIDERYFRPTEVDELCGDASKASERLGWRSKTPFEELIGLMLEHDFKEAGLDAPSRSATIEPHD